MQRTEFTVFWSVVPYSMVADTSVSKHGAASIFRVQVKAAWSTKALVSNHHTTPHDMTTQKTINSTFLFPVAADKLLMTPCA
jgi:hypothetical protein